ncbi:MAG: hypothetical protein LBL25_05080, partial [Oscillospiraceae bacterium]|nr:hypothetical protein [Oscillospiraceae bacterium]
MKKLLAAVLAAFMSLSLVTAVAAGAPQTGDGSPGSPLQIGTEAELLDFAAHVADGETDLCAILTNDVEVEEWDTIAGVERTSANYAAATGPKTDSSHPYAGIFDGNGHKLTLSTDLSSQTTWAGAGIALFHTIDTHG